MRCFSFVLMDSVGQFQVRRMGGKGRTEGDDFSLLKRLLAGSFTKQGGELLLGPLLSQVLGLARTWCVRTVQLEHVFPPSLPTLKQQFTF